MADTNTTDKKQEEINRVITNIKKEVAGEQKDFTEKTNDKIKEAQDTAAEQVSKIPGVGKVLGGILGGGGKKVDPFSKEGIEETRSDLAVVGRIVPDKDEKGNLLSYTALELNVRAAVRVWGDDEKLKPGTEINDAAKKLHSKADEKTKIFDKSIEKWTDEALVTVHNSLLPLGKGHGEKLQATATLTPEQKDQTIKDYTAFKDDNARGVKGSVLVPALIKGAGDAEHSLPIIDAQEKAVRKAQDDAKRQAEKDAAPKPNTKGDVKEEHLDNKPPHHKPTIKDHDKKPASKPGKIAELGNNHIDDQFAPMLNGENFAGNVKYNPSHEVRADASPKVSNVRTLS